MESHLKSEARLRRLARDMGYATFERLPDEPCYVHPGPPPTTPSYPSPLSPTSPTPAYYVQPSQPFTAPPQPDRAKARPFARRWTGGMGDGHRYTAHPAHPAHPAYQRSASSGYPSTRGSRRDSVGSEDTVVALPSAAPLRHRTHTHPIPRPGSPLSRLRPSPAIRSPHPRSHTGSQSPPSHITPPHAPHPLPLPGAHHSQHPLPARPTSPGFFNRPTTSNPPSPELTPSSPPDWTSHYSVSLPSPGARPRSPATARESLRDILDRQPAVRDGGEDVYGEMWGDVVDRRRWRHGLAGREVHLSEPPKSRPRRSFTLPSQPSAHSAPPGSSPPTPWPSSQDYHPYHHPSSAPPPTPHRSFLRALFPPPPPPSSPADPTSRGSPPHYPPAHLPSPCPYPYPCPTPPSTPVSYHPCSPAGLGVRINKPYSACITRGFDVERVYDSLREAEGRVCFAELEGVGSPEVELGEMPGEGEGVEGSAVEETWVEDRHEEGKGAQGGRRRGFPW